MFAVAANTRLVGFLAACRCSGCKDSLYKFNAVITHRMFPHSLVRRMYAVRHGLYLANKNDMKYHYLLSTCNYM